MVSNSNIRFTEHTDFFKNAANAPSPLNVLRESRVVLELGQFFQSLAYLNALPKGDGHPVLVIPGFLTDDRYTTLLRWLLRRQGYAVTPWKQGTNRSFKLRHIQILQKHITRIRSHTGKKVSLVGWSLGGIYARYVTNNMPEHIRQTITLGTPFSKNMTSTVVTKIYELLNRQSFSQYHPDIIRKISSPVPVPSTSIYSKMDGVISWECSVCPSPRENHEHVEIESSHCGLPHNPAALYTILDRLAIPEHNWQPFNHEALSSYMKMVKDPKWVMNPFNHKDTTTIKETLQGVQEIYSEFIQPTSYTG